MRVLVVENEIYLARSIANKLADIGHDCKIASTIREALEDEKFDAILLSTNVSGQNFTPVIAKHKKSIIILMVAYISNDTVSDPIKLGANDYIQKPFMIEELMRKLEHLIEFESLKYKNRTYEAYLEHIFEHASEHKITRKIKLPLLVKTNFQKNADAFMFKLSEAFHQSFQIISLNYSNSLEKLQDLPREKLAYVVNLQHVKKNEKQKIVELIQNKSVVISTTDTLEELDNFGMNEVVLKTEKTMFDGEDILSVEDYVKYVISNFQARFPDTELAKKLGISRKNLWERRKKYGIIKEK